MYASNTTVPVEKTRAEIEKLVTKYGATSFVSGFQPGSASILFDMKGRRVRFNLPIPDRNARKFTHVSMWRPRAKDAAQKLFDQEIRRLWRALLLVVKAKLESVESGVESFEESFLAHFVIEGGGTVGERVIPRLADLDGSQMPPLLGAGGGA